MNRQNAKLICSRINLFARIFCRKCISCTNRIFFFASSQISRGLILLSNDGVTLPFRTKMEQGVRFSCTDGGRIEIGDSFYASKGCMLICRGGLLVVKDNVFLGVGAIVVCVGAIEIGPGCMIAEYVVIRDQDHGMESLPVSRSGFVVAPIVLGGDVWVCAKASILKGSLIGDGAVVGAHSVVRGSIPSGSLAVGAPAKVVKKIRS